MAMIRPETEMKDSGIEWEKIVPIEWNKCRLKDYFEFEKGKNAQIYTKDYIGLHKGNFPVYSGQTENDGVMGAIDTYDYELDECLFSTTVGAKVMTPKVLSGKFSLSQNCLIMRKIRKCVIRFVYYALFPLFDYERTKIPAYMQPSLRIEDLKSYKLYMPLYTEQQAIADYLDEFCSKIDEIIAEAKASILEYEKLRQATIDEKIIGYDCIHVKLRQLGSLKNGLNFSHSDGMANIKFLGVSCFKDNMILTESDDFEDVHVDFEVSDEYMLSNGDIIFVRSNGSKELVGRSLIVENIDYPVTYSGFCIRFRNMHTEWVDNRFLLYYFRSTFFKQSLLKFSNDSTNINNLNQEMLNAIRINAPEINEQMKIVKTLEERILTIDSLIAEKEVLIKDLEAYKKSLIYEVVTGKRRVV